MSASAAGSEHHSGKALTAVFDLFGKLQACAYVAQRPERIGAADRHDVGFAPAGMQAYSQGLQLLLGVVEVIHKLDLGVEQFQQQAVAVALVVGGVGADRIFQQCDTTQAQLRGERRGLAHMVGLDRTGSNQRVGALAQGIGRQVFEFAQLVAAQSKGSAVVTFDVDVSADPGREAMQFFQRGRRAKQVQTIEAG
ncbi:hypothetical protein D3C79_775420 [compost metagenome]